MKRYLNHYLAEYKRFWRYGFDFTSATAQHEYWLDILVNFFIVIMFRLLSSQSIVSMILFVIFIIFVYVPQLALVVRRLCNCGFSWTHRKIIAGAMVVLSLFSFYGLLYMVALVVIGLIPSNYIDDGPHDIKRPL